MISSLNSTDNRMKYWHIE